MVRLILLSALGALHTFSQQPPVRIGSKKFTESVILGEILTLSLQREGIDAEHLKEFGGTLIVWNALETGEIDAYVEYSGTLLHEILRTDAAGMHGMLTAKKLSVSRPLGFNNTYAIGVPSRLADSLDLHNISDLRRYPDLVFGLTNEFMDRRDGWPSLRDRYGLSPVDVRGMDHDLAYRGIASGDVYVTDVYSTDADIAYYDLRVLTDDRRAFPEYLAMVVYRNDFAEKFPSWKSVIRSLEYGINDSVMRGMNAEVKLHGKTERETAAHYLHLQDIVTQGQNGPLWVERIWLRTAEHLVLVGLSLVAAIVLAIPIGIWGARNRRIGDAIVSATGIIQVVPNLALLVMLIPVLGIGFKPAVVALFLYSLLPIVRNTQTGIQTIDTGVRESALALGLPRFTILKWIELPLALPYIISGIKTSAVLNIGTATLGALIGAGGYGQPILTGIRLDNTGLILEGAVPAAVMALMAQGLLGLLEKAVVRRRTKA
jgi:osmoprotectant transport system permease protein